MAFTKTPMDSHKDAIACYELQMSKIHHTQPLWQPSCQVALLKKGDVAMHN